MLAAPLKGIKVLDFTRLYLNYASLFMADLGATVYKIEDLKNNDPLHTWFPKFADSSPYYYMLCRNKNSFAVNFKSEQGQSILHKLITKSDVLIENFRPNTMKKFSLDYENINKNINKSLIYCSITCFGNQISKPGHAINCLAKSGLLSYSGNENGPSLGGGLGADISAVTFAVTGILSALLRRQNDPEKKGEYIDISMSNTMMAKNMLSLCKFNADNVIPENGQEMINGAFACYNIYETKDKKFIALGASESKYWQKLLKNINATPEICQMEYLNPSNQKLLKNYVSAKIKEKTSFEWEKIFEKNYCCANIVKNLKEATENEDFIYPNNSNGVLENKEISQKEIKILRSPIILKNTEKIQYKEAEKIGESTEKIMKNELGYSEDEIKNFKLNKII